jgi:hypothetical protein
LAGGDPLTFFLSEMEADMNRRRGYCTLAACAAMILLAVQAGAVEVNMPFLFIDQFDEKAHPLGFPESRVIQLGAHIDTGGIPLSSVTATNLVTGLVLEPSPVDTVNRHPSGIYRVMPLPAFVPGDHLGVWDITAIDVEGNKASVQTHYLDKRERLPYVEGISASGHPLAPTIRWRPLDAEEVPEGCGIRYRVRLFKSIDHPLHRSPPLASPFYKTPRGVIHGDDIPDIYIHIECRCTDLAEPPDPLPLELRSGSFCALKAALSP